MPASRAQPLRRRRRPRPPHARRPVPPTPEWAKPRASAARHPEMRKLPSGDDAAQFSLATTERFRRKDDTVGEATQWHGIVAYGAAAEVVRTRVRKGDAVLVEGRIATRSWEDKAGNERRAIEIVVAGRSGMVNVITKRKAGGHGGDDDPPGGAAAAAAAGVAAAEHGGDADAVAERAAASSAQDGDEGEGPQDTTQPADDAGGGNADAGDGSAAPADDEPGRAGETDADAGTAEAAAEPVDPAGTAGAAGQSDDPANHA
ncbi:MAG: single-stranded DNA-binding protein [Rhodospirillales bacterium]|nr:single-stranded DNA-binding protein [Rhodospirillales bacterium]